MTELYGWTGTVLHIDLTTGGATTEYPTQGIYRSFMGGRGLAGHYLRPHATRETADPALPLLLFAGPLTGTNTPTSGRAAIMSRSPLTGTACDESVGGRLGTQLKMAGYDGLVITGRSDTPCGIEIRDNQVCVVPAPLWGRSADQVFDELETAMPESASLACIGPAGENGSPLASILVDRYHSAARGGLGMVMGTKNLKYVAIHGTGAIRIHDAPALEEAREEILRLTAASPVLLGQHGFTHWGTGALFDLMDSRCMMPTDNFTRTRFPQALHCNAAAFAHRYSPRSHGCWGCHIRCKKIARDGRTIPDFETMSHFTALIGNTDMDAVMDANEACNRLGLDSVSAGATLACLREITGRDYTPTTLRAAIEEMALGGDLGQGASRLAAALTAPDKAMTVKGLELPAYDPRGALGMALALAVSTRGGCHLRAYPVGHEILRKPVATDRFTFSGKARIIKIAEDTHAAVDSLAACKYTFLAAGLEEYAKAFTAVTGIAMDGFGLQAIGERICYNERIMNAANGFAAVDDDLPHRFFTQPGTTGPGVDINPIDREAFLAARSRYYAVRGLDRDGLPVMEKTRELGL